MTEDVSKFTGVGTVLLAGIANMAPLAERLAPEQLFSLLRTYQECVISTIKRHSAVVYMFAGDDVMAYWHPRHTNPSHAQLAFDTSRAILDGLPQPSVPSSVPPYYVNIALGTGEMGGDFFGPRKQFQVIGMAVSVTDRISKVKRLQGSVVRMCQYTANMLKNTDILRKAGRIKRDGLEPLRMFAYCPANIR